MERSAKACLLICLLLASVLPVPAQAAESGGVQTSSAQLSMTPSNPVMGGSVEFSLNLYNDEQTDAFNVEVAFFKDQISTDNRLLQDEIDIPAGEIAIVTATWNGLTEGTHKIWVEFSANGDTEQDFNVEFEVQGLPNLRVNETSYDQSSIIHSGDSIPLSISILNSGSIDAESSTLLLEVPESEDAMLPTPAIPAGQAVWVNTTILAPSSGVHTIKITPDVENVITEASESGKVKDVSLTVTSRMDLSFKGDLSVSSEEEDLEGPWTITGTMVRTDGSGSLDVPVWLEIENPTGGVITGSPFMVTMAGTGYAETEFSSTLTASTLGSLPDGDHTVTARINPFNQAGFEQESTDNDLTSGQLTISPVPDVYVDANALPATPSVQSGEDVEWRVTVENTGDVEVSGRIQYVFDGLEGESQNINLLSGEARTWTIELSTALGAHTAEFEAQWVALPGSWDSNKQNSIATGTVLVESKLKLAWEYASLELIDSANEPAILPLVDGESYTLQIDLTSAETGDVNFTCEDTSGLELMQQAVAVLNRGDRVSLSCSFTAQAAMTTIRFVPDDTGVVNTFTRNFPTSALAEDGDDTGSSESGTASLFLLVALVLIASFVVAVFLTREREEEVERDIFEYCPSCDGELEGTEDRCPHCLFNLERARSQFHDCHECNESIPDLLENCAYCGAEQDVSSFFERRERRQKKQPSKETVALPEDDDDTIVTGTQNFAEAVKDFGYDEEHLEEEWDANIEAAEAEVEAAYDRRHAEDLATADMTEEELEAFKSQVTTTLRTSKDASIDHDIDAILATKGDLQSLADDGGELTASDAGIRERLFEITGEKGVLPGDKVQVGMGLTDSALAGNEVKEATHDFNFDDDDELPLSASTKSAEEQRAAAKARAPVRRRSARQRAADVAKQEADATPQTAECGACGAELAPDAEECGTCGARFG